MIYLDNAATTRPDKDSLVAAQEILTEYYFNPSARYSGGLAVYKKLDEAREIILSANGDPARYELIFTSGGTEADNQAVFGACRRGNMVTTAGEHSAVERPCNELKSRGIEVRYAPLNRDGSVNTDALLSLVDAGTSLVSVVHVNNETGAVNDIAALARAVKQKNPRAVFHSDGVQAFGKIPFTLTGEIDLYSISAHKIGGCKGTGALFRRKGVNLPALIYGGGQERGLRSGTENVFGCAVFANAVKKRFAGLREDKDRIRTLREKLFSLLDGDLFVRLSPENGSSYILTVSARGMRGEVLQRMLSDRGVVVGTGSACSSKNRFSRILAACGYGEDVLDGVLRISFCPETTEEEIVAAAHHINEAAREFSGRL